MGRRHLVTGGAGFIGSHLVDALLSRGDSVLVLDDCSTGSLENLAQHRDHPRLEVRVGSVCDPALLDALCPKVDQVFHLAAAVGVRRILDRPLHSLITNVRGTEEVLRAACTHGRLPVFLASTSEVYGKGVSIPFREDDDTLSGPTSTARWGYACAKALDEFLALAFHREHGLPVVIGRFFNITGPRQSPAYGMVLPRFCAAAAAGSFLEVHGDGQQRRCFLHVTDCVDAVLRLMDCPGAVGRVINIGGDEETTILDLAHRVQAAAGRGSIRIVPYNEAWPQGGFEDMQRRLPDTTRLRNLTGWCPRHDLDAIIQSCLSTLGRSPCAPCSP